MKMRLLHTYTVETFAHLVVIAAKHGKHHVEWSALYPWIEELSKKHKDDVLKMLDDIAYGMKSTQTLLNKQVQEEKMNNVYNGGQGSEWNKSTLGGS